jgi:rubrerythrin
LGKESVMHTSPYTLKTLNEILDAALAREKEAHLYYSEALKVATAGPVRNLLEELKDAEYKHVQIIEKMIERMRLG